MEKAKDWDASKIRHITQKDRGEYRSREFLTDEMWNEWKRQYDQLLSFRKSIKGKPDEFQKLELSMNQVFIEFYQTVLYHDSSSDKCVCRRCELQRNKNDSI